MLPARLIIDAPLSGSANMARDEALLDSLIAARADPERRDRPAQPVLRFYRWDPPAVSLGYFQPIEQWDEQPERLRRLDVVRRLTGGGAILHDDEVTYSLAAPADLPALAGDPTRLYALAHAAILEALRSLGVPARFHDGPAHGNAQRGPFFCFARRHRYDLVVAEGGEKIVGSAQRRRVGGPAGSPGYGAILQHGSIILRRVGPQPCAGVNDCLARPVAADTLIGALVGPFERNLGVALSADSLAAAEQAAAVGLQARYASVAWTRRR